MSEHTPMPVEVDATYCTHNRPAYFWETGVSSTAGEPLCTALGRTQEEAEAKAARLAQCWNAHDDMLSALKLAQNILFLLKDEVAALGLRAENVPEVVRAAIAKAEGEA